MNVVAFFAGNIAYSLFDSGLANILGLETLRHGTNPINYLGIRLNGGDPDHGGKASGSKYGLGTKNYFHIFKDNEYDWGGGLNILRMKGVGNRVFPSSLCSALWVQFRCSVLSR